MFILRRLLLFFSTLLVAVAGFGSVPGHAEQIAPATITAFAITTVDGKAVQDAPLMAGATYRVSFTVEVAAGLKENALLKTALTRNPGADRLWTLKADYPGIDAASWQPGLPILSFATIPGKAQIELEGSVPADYVSAGTTNGQTLHLGKEIALVELALQSGPIVSSVKREVIDSAIEAYRSVLTAKKQLLTDTVTDPAYAALVKALVASAEAEANVGHTTLALETLKAIPSSGWVPLRASTGYQWIIVGVLAALMALFALLLVKARSESGFLKKQTDGQAKRLQILALKASRIGDSALTDGIEQVRKELQQSAGGG